FVFLVVQPARILFHALFDFDETLADLPKLLGRENAYLFQGTGVSQRPLDVFKDKALVKFERTIESFESCIRLFSKPPTPGSHITNISVRSRKSALSAIGSHLRSRREPRA